MRPELSLMTARITRVREELAGGAAGDALPAQIDDVLTEGYACALTGDAWTIRAEQELHELIGNPAAPVRGRGLRALAGEHAALQRDLIALRRELAQLRADRDRLRCRSSAAASA